MTRKWCNGLWAYLPRQQVKFAAPADTVGAEVAHVNGNDAVHAGGLGQPHQAGIGQVRFQARIFAQDGGDPRERLVSSFIGPLGPELQLATFITKVLRI